MITKCEHCKEEIRIRGLDLDEVTPTECPECGHEIDLLDLTEAVNWNLSEYKHECAEERACAD